MIKKIAGFLKEVKLELQKVNWPTRVELVGSTLVVIVTTALLGIFIGVCDFIISRIVTLIIKL